MGRQKKFHKKIKSWLDGYIDFSKLEFEGYSYIKSTYRNDFASALITSENAEIIKNLIPLFNQKERLFNQIARFIFDRKGKDTDLESSFLLRLYCNGFTNAFKDIDKKIKSSANKMMYPSIEACQQTIQFHISQLEDRNSCPSKNTKSTMAFFDFLLDLGEQEGATIRGLLYQQEVFTGSEVSLPIKDSKGNNNSTTTTNPDTIFKTGMLDKLILLEQKLIQDKFLDENKKWIYTEKNKKEPSKKILVAFLVGLIDNNYFLPKRDSEIKKFFESRYHINIGQTFEQKRRKPLLDDYKAVFYDYPF